MTVRIMQTTLTDVYGKCIGILFLVRMIICIGKKRRKLNKSEKGPGRIRCLFL